MSAPSGGAAALVRLAQDSGDPSVRVDAARQVAHHYARDGRAEDAVAVLRTLLDDTQGTSTSRSPDCGIAARACGSAPMASAAAAATVARDATAKRGST